MRFIHLADVHLGAVPDRGFPWSEARAEEIWETFRRVIALIRKDPVDFLFISGDLFHRQPLLREIREVNYLFSTIPETQVFLMAGNHDYLGKESFYHKFPWEKNVVFFTEERVVPVQAEGQDVFVYGHSYGTRELKEPLYRDVRPMDKPGIHILMAHGGDDTHIPIDFHALHAAGFHYVALGHIHKPQILFPNAMAYAGSLEPLDRNETGVHGYIEGSCTETRTTLRFVPFASRSYRKLTLMVQEDTTQYALEDQIRACIREQGENDLYQIQLKGRRSPDMLFLLERFKEPGNILEVQDETRPAYHLGELERRYSGTLIGAYIAHFREKESLTEIEEKALYYGLQALLETSNDNQTIGNQKFRKNS